MAEGNSPYGMVIFTTFIAKPFLEGCLEPCKLVLQPLHVTEVFRLLVQDPGSSYGTAHS